MEYHKVLPTFDFDLRLHSLHSQLPLGNFQAEVADQLVFRLMKNHNHAALNWIEKLFRPIWCKDYKNIRGAEISRWFLKANLTHPAALFCPLKGLPPKTDFGTSISCKFLKSLHHQMCIQKVVKWRRRFFLTFPACF